MDVSTIIDSFREDFYSLVQQIPEGKVSTYGALARALGDIRAARAVGKMLNENPRPIIVPCHRVVMSDGKIGGFGMGVPKKIEMLAEEGVEVEDGEVVDFEDVLFEDFESDKPLNKLRGNQEEIKKSIIIKDDFDELEIVGGVDVSYKDYYGYAALSIWEGKEEKAIVFEEGETPFPYISSYLSFRETPLIKKLLEKVEKTPDVLLVDGNGIMHPRGIGLASQLGVMADIPTVGVAKSQLCGKLEDEVTHKDPVSRVLDEGNLLGYAYLSSDRAKNPIYVSPGHRVSHETALEVVKMYCNYKIPDPIRSAHINATKRRKEA
ncbi:MAG: endonuclease V [Thermoplasmata archaeon]